MAIENGKITLGLDIPKTAAQINADIKKLQGQLKQVKANGALDTSQTVQRINAQISALQAQLRTVSISAAIDTGSADNAAREAGNAIAQSIADGIRQADENVDREVQRLTDRVEETASAANSGSSAGGMQDQLEAAAEAGRQLQETGKAGLSWAEKIKNTWDKIGGEKLISTAKGKLLSKLQQMPKAVYDIDAAMTKLYRVTDETDRKYTQFLDSACDSAGRLGRSVSDLVDLTASLAESGLSLDDAEALAGISSVYANISAVDDETAAASILAAMEAFHIQASDAVTIVDKLTRLGNEYVASTAALGDGLSRSASAMAAGGSDINKTLAMLAGGSQITGNASSFGDFLAEASMRIRGMTDGLSSLGDEADGAAGSIGKVQAQLLRLTDRQVSILDHAGNARAFYDIMADISKIYDSLSDTNKADLSQILFGTQFESQGDALIQAFQSGQVQSALESSLNAGGAAMAEQERWMESLEAKTIQLDAAFQSFSNHVLDSGLLKWFIDFGTDCVQALDAVAGKLGSFGTLGLGAGIFAGIKNVGSPKMSGLNFEYTDSMPVLPDTAV